MIASPIPADADEQSPHDALYDAQKSAHVKAVTLIVSASLSGSGVRSGVGLVTIVCGHSWLKPLIGSGVLLNSISPLALLNEPIWSASMPRARVMRSSIPQLARGRGPMTTPSVQHAE